MNKQRYYDSSLLDLAKRQEDGDDDDEQRYNHKESTWQKSFLSR